MKLLHALKNDFYRTLFSPIFIIVIIISVMCSILSNYWDISLGNFSACIIYYFNINQSQGLGNLYLVLAVIPAIKLYIEDKKSTALYYQCIRTGTFNYFISKLIVAFISGILVVVLSQVIFAILLSTFAPIYNESGYTMLFKRGYTEPIQYLYVNIAGNALCGGFFSVLCILITKFFNNIFIVASSPLILMFLFDRIFIIFNAPNYIWISKIANGVNFINGFPEKMIYITAFFVLSSFIVSLILLFFVKSEEIN